MLWRHYDSIEFVCAYDLAERDRAEQDEKHVHTQSVRTHKRPLEWCCLIDETNERRIRNDEMPICFLRSLPSSPKSHWFENESRSRMANHEGVIETKFMFICWIELHFYLWFETDRFSCLFVSLAALLLIDNFFTSLITLHSFNSKEGNI